MQGVIYLSGKMCSGKSSVARGLVKIDPRYQIFPVAASLKEAAGQFMGVPVTTENKRIFRPLLQMASEVTQALGNQQRWIDEVYRRAAAAGAEYIVIDDGRFPWEIDAIRRWNVPHVTVRLDAGLVLRQERHHALYGTYMTEGIYSHQSETALDNYPFDIVLYDAGVGVDYIARLLSMKLHDWNRHSYPRLPWVNLSKCGMCEGCNCE